jgi:PAS domain S-box-containing protein
MTLPQQFQIGFLLLQNAALLAIGVIGYCQARQWVTKRLPPWAERLIYGLVLGVLGVGSMLTPIEAGSGVRLDLRNAVVVIATLFGGIEAGAVSLALIVLSRIALGGAGVVAGILSIVIAFALSAGDVVLLRRRGAVVDRRNLAWLGLAATVGGLSVIGLFPRPAVVEFVLLDVAPVWLVFLPLTIVFLGSIVLQFERSHALAQALKESERRFRGLYNETPLMLTATDQDGNVIAVSDAWLQTMGYCREEVVGQPRWAFIAPESIAHLRDEVIPNLEKSNGTYGADLQLLRKDRTLLDVRVSSVRRHDPATGAFETLSVSIDQTARKEAERALEMKESEFSAIVDNAPFAIFLKDNERRYRMINRCYTDWFGDRLDDLYGRTTEEVYSPAIAEPGLATDREVLELGRVASLDRPVEEAKAGLEYVQVTKFPVRDNHGEIVGMAGFIADISDRKRAELALRESQELLLKSQRLGKLGYVLVDWTSYRSYWSESLVELLGLPQREFFPIEEAIEFIDPRDRAAFLEARNAGVTEGRDFEIDVRLVRPDGAIAWEHVVGHPRIDDNGTLTSVLLVVLDITESKRAAAALHQSEERFRALIEYSNDMVAIVRPDGIVTYRSPSSTEQLGFAAEEVVGRSMFDRVHPDDRDIVTEAFRAVAARLGHRVTARCRVRHKDGSWHHIAWSARNATDVPGVDGIIVNSRDVTEEQLLEEQLLQAQKMEAVGQLAGGIAHDFNNIVGAILGFAGFLLQDLPKETPEHGFARHIATAGERAKDLVQQILAFSRRSTVERKPIDLAHVLLETKHLIRASLPSSTELALTATEEGLVAEVNAGQISQILLNLCLNANDALQSEPGTVSIELSRLRKGDRVATAIDANAAEAEMRLVTGELYPSRDYARLTVVDTGVGMSAEVLKRIFDPFFTTKERGRGTGLGLSVVHGIVMAYGGACVVTSRPGTGSVFAIYLPLTAIEAATAASEAAMPVLRGRERVLVVDDETEMTDMLTIGLDRLGYEVVALNDSEEALAVFTEDPKAWDVVISDQVMPRMKGLTLFHRLKSVRASLRFILCTGFSDGATEKTALAAGVDAFLLKPVSPEQLAASIRRLLDEPLGPSAAVDRNR